MSSRKSGLKMAKAVGDKKLNKVAQSSSSAFTAKQSSYARKNEEELVRAAITSKFEGRITRPANAVIPSGPRQHRSTVFSLDSQPVEARDNMGGFLGSSSAAMAPPPGPTTDDRNADAKKTKRERFDDVVEASKLRRVESQKLKEEREKQVETLDSEFADIMHLLQSRNPRTEEQEAFRTSGDPKVLAALKAMREKRGEKGGTFRLGADGEWSKTSDGTKVQTTGKSLDADDEALLAKIRKKDGLPPRTEEGGEPAGPAPAPAPPKPAPTGALAKQEQLAEDFDKLMGTFKLETRKAVAQDALPSEEQLSRAAAREQALKAERGEKPAVGDGGEDMLFREYLDEGGQRYHVMDSDEEGGEEGDDVGATKPRQQQVHIVDEILGKLEAACTKKASVRADEVSSLMTDLWRASKKHSHHASQSFKMLLIELQRQHKPDEPLTPYFNLILYCCVKIFPQTDFRHDVTTPLLLFLCQATMQHAFVSVEQAKQGLFFASMLLHSVHEAKRYCGEVVVMVLNLIALQLPLEVLEPKTHRGTNVRFPLLARTAEPILTTKAQKRRRTAGGTGASQSAASIDPPSLLDTAEPSEASVVVGAYRLLAAVVALYGASPSFPAAVAEPFEALDALLQPVLGGDDNEAVRREHTAALEAVRAAATAASAKRVPLALRTFRPKPLRLFEPQLGLEDEKLADRDERELKKEIREDTKRVTRHLQAEAVVQRRAREREMATVDAHRDAKYRELMADLQSQQHIMKTVDTLMAKSRQKKKKGVSGMPDEDAGEGGAEA